MSTRSLRAAILIFVLFIFGCTNAQIPVPSVPRDPATTSPAAVAKIKNPGRVIHVLVALCDNEHQGIVPVPAHLGNGDDLNGNLYWGAGYGIRAFFSKSREWEKIGEIENPKTDVLERLVFRHRTQNVYLVADAYRGSRMKKTVDDFFSAVSGTELENVRVRDTTLQVLGSADLIVFVGHNGLMDFKLQSAPTKHDDEKREAIILACASRSYFMKPLKESGAEPLLWTSNLMAPEAYTLHDAIEGWVRNESPQQVRERAAAAYAKYQKISQKAALGLLVTGW